MARAARFGLVPLSPMSLEEALTRAVFLATSDRYAFQGGGLVPVPEGLEVVKRSGWGFVLVDPLGENANDGRLLAELRDRGVGEAV